MYIDAKVVFGAFAAVLVLSAGVGIYSTSVTRDTLHHVTVTEKERVVSKDTSKYLIFTDREVLRNTDSLWLLKFNSSDVYGQIKIGDVCSFQVYGWRVPFLSMYRNIISFDCVGH
jgi:hypothetical protein